MLFRDGVPCLGFAAGTTSFFLHPHYALTPRIGLVETNPMVYSNPKSIRFGARYICIYEMTYVYGLASVHVYDWAPAHVRRACTAYMYDAHARRTCTPYLYAGTRPERVHSTQVS